jgi:hypothetical protein
MQFIRFLSLLLCAEWLLIFRIWASFRWLVLFVAFTFIRARILGFIPHWDSSYIIFPVAAVAMLYHLRCTWNRRSARNREIYNAPDTGVPWLLIFTPTRNAAQFLESVIMVGFVVYMVRYGNLVFPPEFGALPPAWQAWLTRPGHAGLFSMLYAISAMIGLAFWNVIASGAPLWKPRAAPSPDTYPHVREERRRPPRLPSVKELADEHQQLYG